MRVSDIAAWATCEAMALAAPPLQSRISAAAWVGTLAHAYLLRQDVPVPPRLRYDEITKSTMQAGIQAKAIADYARQLLDRDGWHILESEQLVANEETEGHLDILAGKSGGRDRAIIDLKTGQHIGTGWLQVGGYLTLEGSSIDYGGILHIPRVRVDRDVKGTLEIRPGPALANEWGKAATRIYAVLAGFPATSSPGLHCGRCSKTNCAVRAG